MERNRRRRAVKGQSASIKKLVDLESNQPGHCNMLQEGNGKYRVELSSAKITGQPMRIADYVRIRIVVIIETYIFAGSME